VTLDAGAAPTVGCEREIEALDAALDGEPRIGERRRT